MVRSNLSEKPPQLLTRLSCRHIAIAEDPVPAAGRESPKAVGGDRPMSSATGIPLSWRLWSLGVCPRIRPHPTIAPEFHSGLGPFGLDPALGAHYPPALAGTPQV